MKYFVPLLLLAACTKGPELPEVKVPTNGEVNGLIEKIQLNHDATPINLNDYFVHPEEIDSIHWPAGIRASATTDSMVVWLNGKMEHPLGTARIYLRGFSFDLLLKNSGAVEHTFKFASTGESVHVFGSMNAWNRMADTMENDGGIWSKTFLLEPGDYEYKYFVDGAEKVDDHAEKVSNGLGGFNNSLKIEIPGEPAASLKTLRATDTKFALASVPMEQKIFAFWNNQLLADEYIVREGDTTWVYIPEAAASKERSFIRIYSCNEHQVSNDLLIPMQREQLVTNATQLKRDDWEASVFYFLMVDRFFNADTANDQPLNLPEVIHAADYHGGDIAGVKSKLDQGYFTNLGINTIWLSPITRNPQGPWGLWDKGGVKTKFSGYHGYWPISNVLPDERLGDSSVIRQLLDDAHEKNFNVILDYVANHVHQEHPIILNNPDWSTPLYLPDGSMNTERWDEYRLTTWFDTFLPTLELRRQDIVDPMTDSAMVWITKYPFDGFRHDATKHIAEKYWRTLTSKVKVQSRERNQRIYQIGETYGSPSLIASYIGNGLLNAQFDFNVYDAATSVFSSEKEPVDRVLNVLQSSLNTYGYHNLMGYISGNQDRSRFISLASGDVAFDEDQKLAGYTRNIGTPNALAYKKLLLLQAFNFSIPGIPVIYYGDEYGMPGANDPDNRRDLKFTGYSNEEENTLEAVKSLIHLRRTELPLIYGETEIIKVNESVFAIVRNYMGKRIVTVFNRSEKSSTIARSDLHLSEKAQILVGTPLSADGQITLAPYEFTLLKQ